MRGRDKMVKLWWRRHWVRHVAADTAPLPTRPVSFTSRLPIDLRESIVPQARDRVIACADRLLRGEWKIFAVDSVSLGANPDWFADPRSGRRAPQATYAFGIDHRAEHLVGNIKYVWEISRHHHLTVLATAYYLTADERYARRVAEQLTSWWHGNPFLSGVHWTSGIEVGVRLMSWVWVRRLLDSWSGTAELFDRNPLFLRQLRYHQRFVATLPSHNSSGNNHLIAEAAGLFASACAFPWFPESDEWRARAARILCLEISRQTFPSGLNRELASGYHAFVLELCIASALEGEAAGCSLGVETWEVLRRMTDTAAAIVDVTLRPPRQGDGDDASGLLLDDPDYDRWSALLTTGAVLFGRLPWWPQVKSVDVRTALWTALSPVPEGILGQRAERRPSLLADAGMAILRDHVGSDEEIWCRCDHGPLGFLSLAAHGHADALSVELRHDGIDILADPGTYCYHGDAEWRAYFRSTIGHNTLEVGSSSQAVDGGPFLWLRPTRSRAIQTSGLDEGPSASWTAEHDGYTRLVPPATHCRRVDLDRITRTVTVTDRLVSNGEHPCRLAFHLGDQVSCDLDGHVAVLRWTTVNGTMRGAALSLPRELAWSAVCGQTDPPLGWYSPAFDEKRPTTTLIGVGQTGHARELRSVLRFDPFLAASSQDNAVLHDDHN